MQASTSESGNSPAAQKSIPYIVILTKCDAVSAKLKVEKRRVFEDKKVKECKNILMDNFGVKQQQICPVVNYTNENLVDLQADALLIAVFNDILNIGKDKLEDDEEEDDD